MQGGFDPLDDDFYDYGDEYTDHTDNQYAKLYVNKLYELLASLSTKKQSASALRMFRSSEAWSQTITYNTDMYDRYHGKEGIILNLLTGKFEKK